VVCGETASYLRKSYEVHSNYEVSLRAEVLLNTVIYLIYMVMRLKSLISHLQFRIPWACVTLARVKIPTFMIHTSILTKANF
jgi:hypothetical protein